MRKQIIIFTLIIIALIIAGGISTKDKKYPANYNFVVNGTGDSLFRASPDSVAMYVSTNPHVIARISEIYHDSITGKYSTIISTAVDSATYYTMEAVTTELTDRIIDSTRANIQDSIAATVTNVFHWLPDTTAVVCGDTIQIFFNSVFSTPDQTGYQITTNAVKGTNYPRYWEYAPTYADTLVNNYKLIFELKNQANRITCKDTTIIKVKKGWRPLKTVILPFGDSWSEQTNFTTEYYRRLAGIGGTPAGRGWNTIVSIGDKGVSPNQRVAKGGKQWSYFTTAQDTTTFWFYSTHGKTIADIGAEYADDNGARWIIDSMKTTPAQKIALHHKTRTAGTKPPASGTLTYISGGTDIANMNYTDIQEVNGNPFWDYLNNKLSIKNFVDRNGLASPEVFIVLMTWNDIYTPFIVDIGHYTALSGASFQAIMGQFHSDYPTAKAIICTLGNPSIYGHSNHVIASGFDLRVSTYGNYFGYAVSCNTYNRYLEYMVKTYYSSWATIIGTGSVFDTEWCYQQDRKWEKKPNIRHSSYFREITHNNGIHPNTDGYNLLADQVYREFIRLFCK